MHFCSDYFLCLTIGIAGHGGERETERERERETERERERDKDWRKGGGR